MKKLLLTHGYSDSNKGDLAIICGMVQAFREVHPNLQINMHSVFSDEDPDFDSHARHIGKRNVHVHPGVVPSPYVDGEAGGVLRDARALIRLISGMSHHFLALAGLQLRGKDAIRARRALSDYREADWVVSKGGQFIYNDQSYLRGILYLWRVLEVIRTASRLKRPVYVMGQSIGPINYPLGRMLAASALKKVTQLVVREDLSASLLQGLGVDPARIVKAPDFAFMIQPDPDFRLALPAATGYLGVTVVDWYYPGAPDVELARAAYVDELAKTIRRCYAELKLLPILIPQVTVKHHGGSDADLIDLLREKLKNLSCPSVAPTDDFTPEQICSVYGQCRVLLGTRLHSCILATCAETPVVAIRYQGFKTEGVMKELGLGEFVHDISTVNSDELFADLQKLGEEREMVSADLRLRVNQFRTQLLELAEKFLK